MVVSGALLCMYICAYMCTYVYAFLCVCAYETWLQMHAHVCMTACMYACRFVSLYVSSNFPPRQDHYLLSPRRIGVTSLCTHIHCMRIKPSCRDSWPYMHVHMCICTCVLGALPVCVYVCGVCMNMRVCMYTYMYMSYKPSYVCVHECMYMYM